MLRAPFALRLSLFDVRQNLRHNLPLRLRPLRAAVVEFIGQVNHGFTIRMKRFVPGSGVVNTLVWPTTAENWL